ncbi:MAG: hypothetical protein IPO99_10675 [Nitrospira sp.]|nr:hypothetical protein [Nitrospira sp.]
MATVATTQVGNWITPSTGENLEEVVRTRTVALQQALGVAERSEKELRLSREETIQRLAIAARIPRQFDRQHIQRMGHHCELLARRYGLSPERCDHPHRQSDARHRQDRHRTMCCSACKFTPED